MIESRAMRDKGAKRHARHGVPRSWRPALLIFALAAGASTQDTDSGSGGGFPETTPEAGSGFPETTTQVASTESPGNSFTTPVSCVTQCEAEAYSPVCAAEQLYPNECVANCMGVFIFIEGECGTTTVSPVTTSIDETTPDGSGGSGGYPETTPEGSGFPETTDSGGSGGFPDTTPETTANIPTSAPTSSPSYAPTATGAMVQIEVTFLGDLGLLDANAKEQLANEGSSSVTAMFSNPAVDNVAIQSAVLSSGSIVLTIRYVTESVFFSAALEVAATITEQGTPITMSGGGPTYTPVLAVASIVMSTPTSTPTTAPTRAPADPVGLLLFEFLEGEDLFAAPRLRLVFSGAVVAGSFDPSAITLQDSATAPASSFRLQATEVAPNVTGFTDTLVVTLSVEDLLAILASDTLARSESSTFLSLDAGSLNTITGAPIIGTDGMQVSRMTADFGTGVPPTPTGPTDDDDGQLGGTTVPSTTSAPTPNGVPLPPALLGVKLDMSAATIELSFRGDVNISTLDLRRLVVAATPFADAFQYRFSAAAGAAVVDSSTVLVIMAEQDYLELLANQDLATHQITSFFSTNRGLIKDYFGQSSLAISSVAALQAQYTPDTVAPLLVGFVLDLFTGTMTMVFTEPVNIDTVNYPGIGFVSSQGATSTLSLTGGTASQVNLTSIAIALRVADVIQIRDASAYLLTVSAASLTDMAGNGIEAIASGDARTATDVILGNPVPDPEGPSTGTKSGGTSLATKILVGVGLTIVLLLILLAIFIVPRWRRNYKGSAYFWDAPDTEGGAPSEAPRYNPRIGTPLLTTDLEWDTQMQDSGSAAFVPGDTLVCIKPCYARVEGLLEVAYSEEIVVVRNDGSAPGYILAVNARNQVGLVPLAHLVPLGLDYLPEPHERATYEGDRSQNQYLSVPAPSDASSANSDYLDLIDVNESTLQPPVEDHQPRGVSLFTGPSISQVSDV
eukprot:m.20197 g.20197  ORF g.20197 m.20197 type:complete len:961 (+) comp3765_c0_seq1:245-3127(+)